MRKLLVAETIAVIASMAMVIVGSVMEWPDEAIAVTTYIVAVFVAVIMTGAFAVAIAAVAAGVAAAVVAVFTPIATVVGLAGGSIAIVVTIICIAAAAGVAVERLKIKYRWVFLSLLGEGVIIGAVLYYGSTIIRAMV